MFGKRPQGVIEGQLVKNPKSQLHIIGKELYERNAKTFYLPAENFIHQNELMELELGNRSCPKLEDGFEGKIQQMLGMKSQPAELSRLSHIIGEYRSAYLQKTKLDNFLALQGRDALVQPKPFQQHPMLFISYASAKLDPNNFTMWKEGEVNVSDELMERFKATPDLLTYIDFAWVCKRVSFEALVKYGLDTQVAALYNIYMKLCREAVNVNKFRYLHRLYPNSRKNYHEHVKNSEEKIKAWTQKLADKCYLQKYQLSSEAPSKENCNDAFKGAAKIAIEFDPLSLEYDNDFFQNSIVPDKLPSAYKMFVERAKKIRELVAKIQSGSSNSYVMSGETVDKSDLILETVQQSSLVKRPPEAMKQEAETKKIPDKVQLTEVRKAATEFKQQRFFMAAVPK